MRKLATLALAALAACSHSQPSAPAPSERAWIARSNEDARLLLDVQARFAPEQAAQLGQTGYDDRILDLLPGHEERLRGAVRDALAKIDDLRTREQDALVAQDLSILADAARKVMRGSELSERLEVPYHNLPRFIFFGVRALLDDQVDSSRRPAALVRVR